MHPIRYNMTRYVSLSLVIATIVVNGLANAIPINGQQTGQVSDRFDVYFTPAGYVFSIWGLIYLSLFAFAIYQLLPAQRNSVLIRRITVPFWISSVANMSWLLCWHYEYFGTTLVLMLLLLASLIWVTRILFAAGPAADVSERWCLRTPFSVYLGWITVATIANLTIVLEEKGLRPWDMNAQEWAVAMVIMGGVVAFAVGRIRSDLAYLSVILWAFTGIAVAQEWRGPVSVAALAVLGVIGLQSLWILSTRKEKTGSWSASQLAGHTR